jgi:hypothetical protein
MEYCTRVGNSALKHTGLKKKKSGGLSVNILATLCTQCHSGQELLGVEPSKIKKDQHVLMRLDQDKHAAHRWHLLNRIRRKKSGVKAKLLEYFLENVGERIPGEELQYLAKNKKNGPGAPRNSARKTDGRLSPGIAAAAT